MNVLAVIDTNVLVSAFWTKIGRIGREKTKANALRLSSLTRLSFLTPLSFLLSLPSFSSLFLSEYLNTVEKV